MKILFSARLWTVLAVVLSTVMALMIVATNLANSYSTLIATELDLETWRVDYGDGEKIDFFTADYTTHDSIKEFAHKTSYDLEADGLVLLKNEEIEPGVKALPLDKSATPAVSLFGKGSVNPNRSVQGARNPDDKTNPDLKDFKSALEAENVSVNPTLWDFYVQKENGTIYKQLDPETNVQTYYIREVPSSDFAARSDVTGSFATYGDAAIMVVTRDSTEGSDVNVVGSDGDGGNYLSLSAEERDVLKMITDAKYSGEFKRVIVILNTAMPLELDFLYDNGGEIEVDACLWVGNMGMSGIEAVADALVGDVNPSGSLPDTYAKDNLTSPVMASWTLNENSAFSRAYEGGADVFGSAGVQVQGYYGVYNESIYVGYKYYETRYADVVEGRPNVGRYDYAADVAYPFGHGESYTEFDYSDFTVTPSADGKTFDVAVTVTNIGGVPGREPVQIYAQKPYTARAQSVLTEVAAVELVGFGKTALLQPQASETVHVTVEKEQFATYDVYGYETYILDTGTYYLTAATDAHAAVNNILAKKHACDDAVLGRMVGEGDASLVNDDFVVSEVDLTYSASSETGAEITNALEDIDINRYAGAGNNMVTYTSRSDWEGTWPTEAIEIELTDRMIEDMQSEARVPDSEGDMPQFGRSNGLSLIQLRGAAYGDDRWDLLLDQISFDEMNTMLTTAYCITAAIPSVVKPQTAEQDGPTYCKQGLTGSRFPCEGIWAATMDRELLAEVGTALANDSLFAGYNGMWIPGINIHRSPYSGRNHEYFSEDSFLTGAMAEAQIRAMQGYGVIAYPKHYVLNDQESNRNGVGIWANEQAIREIYIMPWKYACAPSRGNAHGVMSSFNRTGCVWSSAQNGLVNVILRDEIGFNGIIITDMADANGTMYMTVTDGLMAGTDLWLSSGKDHSFTQYRDNATIVRAMREATKRVLYNVCNYSAAMNGFSETTRVIRVYTWVEILVITLDVTFGVLTAGALAMLLVSTIKRHLKEKKEMTA